MDAEVCWLKKFIKFGITKKILRRGKVEKPFNLSLSKENYNYDIILPRRSLGTMDANVSGSF